MNADLTHSDDKGRTGEGLKLPPLPLADEACDFSPRAKVYSGRAVRTAQLEAWNAAVAACAAVCDANIWALDNGGNRYFRPAHAETCAALIRALAAGVATDGGGKSE